ncbi:uncharacterized protein EV420DRAFT_1476132 [Desarmillaria tabescens]|uniref:Uncharacterized protein n=1 Tax=Armillaria tabescens TaxID=1929756 RepID=A0AA39NFL6_ARMTA|nr:uncharacterized protein EV420DRAFT_1476132 [Desarmillaria tabescens]KAK0464736.1 hypothetical protein EV420DRAFT_1476132 [Desarmillaria tabescens]
MANITRSSKAGNEWTSNDLNAYNISITFQDALTFFDETALPAPSVHQEILTAPTADQCVLQPPRTTRTRNSTLRPGGFGTLSHSFRYIHRPRAIRTRKKLRFFICRESKYSLLDVCILDRDTDDVILLVQEDKQLGQGDGHARLVAGAIAAFQVGNAQRREVGLTTLDSRTQVIPGIIMVGTSPTFFKIPVTRQLAVCVEFGRSPLAPTIVTGHVPDIPRPNRRFSEGMRHLANRRVILQCYEAFKKFVV